MLGLRGEDGEDAPVQAPREGVCGAEICLFQFGVLWAVMVCSPMEIFPVAPGFLRGERTLPGSPTWQTPAIVTGRGGNINRFPLSCPELPSSPGRQLQ